VAKVRRPRGRPRNIKEEPTEANLSLF